MRRSRFFIMMVTGLFAATLSGALAAPDTETLAELKADQKGAADFAPAGRYEGATLLAQTVKDFDELTLASGPAVSDAANPQSQLKSTVTAEGRVMRSLYVVPPGRSTLEILANHRNSLTAAGFTPVFSCTAATCGENFPKLVYDTDNAEMRVVVEGASQTRRYLTEAMFDYVKDVRYALLKKTTPGGDSYVGIYLAQMTGGSRGDYSTAVAGNEGVLIQSVEPKAMEQKIVTVTADEIDLKLASDGRAAFYGLYFDTDKSDIKPESDAQLAEMGKYLTEHPDQKVYVVGHTDNEGALDYNLALSQKRAQAVSAALTTKYKIPASRLVARGLGPLAPVAGNGTEGGRAKNRRVELAQQ